MTDNSKKISELPTTSNVASTDKIIVLKDPLGDKKLYTTNIATLAANLTLEFGTPFNSSANGVTGMLKIDDKYLYVCVSKNDWKRVALEIW